MAYTSLYRKFRPLSFKDMVGQEHITQTLKNQIIADRVGHAYLFNGGRGTGKTTTAKILARAVNCLNPQNGEPCNECEICKEILNGSLTDVVEMDAASNNSVEDIRSIREEVNFLPTKAKYRVYIIDEVHMLSTGAFNALLKTLEEPPEHVKFFLATTEPQKIPSTILSRCQRFDYKRISNKDIIKRLKTICKEDEISITEEALNTIAILSEGAMRDAISILERCSQDSKEEIKQDDVKNLVGIPSIEYISQIVESIIKKDEIEAINVAEQIINQGKDIYNFLWEMIKYLKDILIYKTSKKLEIYSKEEIEKIDNLSNIVTKEELLNIIYDLSKIESDIKFSSQKTIMFETGIIKTILDNKQNKNDFQKEEKTNKQTQTNKTNINEQPKQELEQTIKSASINLDIKKEQTKTIKEKVQTDQTEKDLWKNVLNTLKTSGKYRLYSCLANTIAVKQSDLVLEIKFPNGMTNFNKQILDDVNNKNDLIKAIANITGQQMHLKYGNDNSNTKKTEENNLLENLGININIID